jgi:hypothetical protein
VRETIQHAWHWMADAPQHRQGARILQIAIGSMILFRLVTEIPYALYFWGPNSIAIGTTHTPFGTGGDDIVNAIFATGMGTYLFLLLLGIGAGCLVFGYRTPIATPIVYLTFNMLSWRFEAITDGGDTATQIILFFMLFLLAPNEQVKPNSMRVWYHNCAIVALSIQIMMLYSATGFAKLRGTLWQDGTALYYITQVQAFTLPGVSQLFRNAFLVTIATYVPMFHQILFPVAIFSRLKPIWIVIGILFHLSIAILMGLIPFSTAMIGLELVLLSDHDYAVLLRKVQIMSKWIQSHFSFMVEKVSLTQKGVTTWRTVMQLGYTGHRIICTKRKCAIPSSLHSTQGTSAVIVRRPYIKGVPAKSRRRRQPA